MRRRKCIPIEDRIPRFFKRVRKTAWCWIWMGAKTGMGYGSYRGVPAHRFAWAIANGPIPANSVICHNCDVKLCVNPLHLFRGTPKDNYLDRPMKPPRTRYQKRCPPAKNVGMKNGKARLTDGKVLLIRAMYATGRFTQTEIGRALGVHSSNIHQIVRREIWAHVKASWIAG
jgi:HNH endonuclease